MTRDVIRGLVLLEGSFPVDHLHPGLKHLVHYGPQTDSRGALDWFEMWAFERNNKRVKSMVKHSVKPLSSLANEVELDIRTRLETLTKLSLQQEEEITLTVRARGCVLTDRETQAMEMVGTSDRGFWGAKPHRCGFEGFAGVIIVPVCVTTPATVLIVSV